MPLPCNQASDYYTGSDSWVFIGDTLLTVPAPNQATITLTTATPAVATLGTQITVSVALTKAIKAGERLKFGSSVVQVDNDVAIGATTIPIVPALSAITIGSTCTKNAWVRYDSFASADINLDSEMIEIRNVGACKWKSQLKTKLMANISLDGNVLSPALDLGRNLIRQAAMSTGSRIAIGILEPDGSWFQAKCQVKSLGRKIATDTAFTQSVSLEVDGDPTYGTATDLVLA
jgi:hypothetical protein